MNFLGNSHFGLEDVSIVRSIPNINIISPADCGEIVKAVNAIAKSQVPTYLRLTGIPNMPSVYQEEYHFEIGKIVELSPGEDVTIIASGSMVNTAIQVSNKLEEQGIACGVVNCHTIVPIDRAGITNLSKKTARLVTLEEHFDSGGLGTAVLEFLNESGLNIPLHRLGLKKSFPKTGSYEFMLQHTFLSIDHIQSSVVSFLHS
jgi:transketolase